MIEKTVYEELTQYCDFSDRLATGETISTTTGQVFDDAGVDQSTSMIANVARYAPAYTSVSYLIKGGTAGKSYKIVIKIVTSASQKMESDVFMVVK